MTRATILYAARRAYAGTTPGHDPDTPVEGWFRMSLRTGGVKVGIRVWYGAPTDPETGEEMDRSWRWQATCNGDPIDLERVWPACAGDPINEDEAEHLANLQRWGRSAGHAALADPRKRLDPLTAPLPF